VYIFYKTTNKCLQAHLKAALANGV